MLFYGCGWDVVAVQVARELEGFGGLGGGRWAVLRVCEFIVILCYYFVAAAVADVRRHRWMTTN